MPSDATVPDGSAVSYLDVASAIEAAPTLATLIKRDVVVFDTSTRLVNPICLREAILASEEWDRALRLRLAPIVCLPARNGFAACAATLRGSVSQMRIAFIVDPAGPVIRGVVWDEQGSDDPTLVLNKVDLIYRQLAERGSAGC